MLIFCFILSFSALHSLNHSAFLSCSFSLSHMLPQNYLLFSIRFIIIDISYTIHLLINFFLILDKHSVNLILIHSPHISSALLFLHGVTVSALLSLFLFLFSLCYTSFQVPHIFHSSLSLFSDVLRCLCVS